MRRGTRSWAGQRSTRTGFYPRLTHVTFHCTSGARRGFKIGLFSVGLAAYWPQFVGLRERLIGYNESIAAQLANSGVEVINLGLIDTVEKSF